MVSRAIGWWAEDGGRGGGESTVVANAVGLYHGGRILVYRQGSVSSSAHRYCLKYLGRFALLSRRASSFVSGAIFSSVGASAIPADVAEFAAGVAVGTNAIVPPVASLVALAALAALPFRVC